MYCLDPDSASEPQAHPVILMASERLLALAGPTFMSRLWCRVELLMFADIHSAGSIDIVPIAGCALLPDTTDTIKPGISGKLEKVAMQEVVEACGSVGKFNSRLKTILDDVLERAAQEIGDTATDSKVDGRRARRLSGTMRLTEKLGHLVRQFEKFNPRYDGLALCSKASHLQ